MRHLTTNDFDGDRSGGSAASSLHGRPTWEAPPQETETVSAVSPPSPRILIIEDHVLLAESLELALSLRGYDVVTLCLPESGGSMSTLRSTALRRNAQIVLLDLDLGRFGDGMSLIEPLSHAGADVVVTTASTDRGRWGTCIRQGARKVLPKVGPLQETLDIVRRLHHGEPVMSHEEQQSLLDAWSGERTVTDEMRGRLELLTPREKHVLGCLLEGNDVREIAHLGVVSEATVRSQVKSILFKLQVSSQLGAVGLARRVQWQPATPQGLSPLRHAAAIRGAA